MVLSGKIIAQDFRSVEKKVDSLLEAGILPSMAIGILKEGEVIYEKAFGYADVENKRMSTTRTPYQLASLSKPITATAIMQLHEEGSLNIDDPITKYVQLKKVDDSYQDPTIRQVLNHTSGLGTYFDIYYADEQISYVDFETAWSQYGIQFHPPGLVCEYSNLGYGLLDFIITKVTGMPFASYLRTDIFDPLGMGDALLVERSDDKALAKKYGVGLKVLPEVWNNTAGAGNIAASVQDIMQFASLHLQERSTGSIGDTNISAMQTYREPNALFHYYQDTYYGLGWYVMADDQGQKVVWHEGGMMGASTMLKFYPKEQIAIVLLTNTYHPAVCRRLSDELTRIMLPGYEPTPINEVADYSPIASDSTIIGDWSGIMHIADEQRAISLQIAEDGVDIRYLDDQFRSFLTDYQPLPYHARMLFGAINQGYFIGTGTGDLPAKDSRENPHLLSLKLYKEENTLKGTIISMAAAEREYYARPYYIQLTKE